MLIGHVGSFSPVKNHEFLIRIAKELKRNNFSFKMIFVGDGGLKKEVENRVKDECLDDVIMFLGVRSDIPQIMSMIDILLLPSFYEGVPGVIVEAQAAGTLCIISDTVTREVDAGLGLTNFISIESVEKWCEVITQQKVKEVINQVEVYKKLNDNGFIVEGSIRELEKIYKI